MQNVYLRLCPSGPVEDPRLGIEDQILATLYQTSLADIPANSPLVFCQNRIQSSTSVATG